MKFDEMSINSGLKGNEIGVAKRDSASEREKGADIEGRVSATSVSISLGSSSTDTGRSVFAKVAFASVQISVEHYEKLYVQNTPSPGDVANVILGAVKGRLEQEKNAGAGDERLLDILEQANRGVEKGYQLAKEDIRALGLMTEELDAEIDESYGLVKAGLNELELDAKSGDEKLAQFTDSELLQKSRPENQVSKEIGVGDLVGRKVGGELRVDSSGSYSSRYAESQGYELQLFTRDGDRLNITLNRSFAEGVNVTRQGSEYASSADLSFQISVQGELDEGERKAVDDLLSQASEIAELFYSDQYLEAFNAALGLGFDSSEIASFSLDLRQSTYQEIRSYESQDSGGVSRITDRQFQPLVDMVNALDGFRQSESFFEKLLVDMNEFVDSLLDGVNALRAEDNREVAVDAVGKMKAFSGDLMLLLQSKNSVGIV